MITSTIALDIFNTAVKSVSAAEIIPQSINLQNGVLTINSSVYRLSSFDQIYVIGAGKASAQMACVLESVMGDFLTSGLVITKYGHSADSKKIKILEAGHPVPDSNTLKHSREILKIAEKAGENDLVICLISGGGSALLEVLPDAITLEHLQQLNMVLLSSGADISAINTLRKKISLVKGGGLAHAIYPAECLTIIISDVIGDNPQDIASGPTVLPTETDDQVLKILQKYNLKYYLDPIVYNHLISPSQKSSENEKRLGEKVKNYIIANNQTALASAQSKALEYGFNPVVVSSNFSGEATDVAAFITKTITKSAEGQDKKTCLLFGGESTVKIKGNGKGGRNMELALAALIQLKDFKKPFVLLSAGTDGSDGPTDAAGALITSLTMKSVEVKGLEPQIYLNNNDSYTFFKQTGGLVNTGPTGTNVMDLVIVLID